MAFLHKLLITFTLGIPIGLTTGCLGSAANRNASEPPKGKVLIQYRVTDYDRGAPPSGFVVWRSKSELGPYQQVHQKVLPFTSNQLGSDQLALVYVDSGLPLHDEFFYFLERVEKDGTRKTVAPPVRTKVMLPMTNRELSQWENRTSKTPDKPRG